MADYGTYASVADLKALLKVDSTDTTDDSVFRRQLEMASRAIDRHCNRWFYSRTETRYPTHSVGLRLRLDADLLSVTTFKTDENQDGTYENTLAVTDYVLFPYSDSEFPKLQAELDLRAGDYYYWPRGTKPVQIAGVWGYGDGRRASPWDNTGATGTVGTTAGTALTVTSVTPFAVGQNILVESEQMYVTAVGILSLTVVRGINGTTVATHSAKAVSVAAYPEEVEQACFIEATRLWKRKDSGFSYVYGDNSLGVVQAGRGLDKDAAELLAPFGKWLI